ncbi:outer membrane lipoprotein-sorting protein [Prosthecobacter sp.]|uniref:outer membrane lipoprotein-sorting protein n=1 Tax=Prosthecobacter sp. TaxID=1965333 RepID=UPI002ABA99E6|nr:outer membrane lipoprotein-sorting protein [Prosthecobacter sp.]MDZ4403272.1 outer membrane lipoprotein-sorting protein [Prosthecobacter sp.]
MKPSISLLVFALTAFQTHAADSPPALSASDLAAKLSALQQDGASFVRLKLEVKGATKVSLQLQIKQRRTKAATEVVYQILWPKERLGESVLLRKTGSQAGTGSIFVPPATVRALDSSQMKEALFGSDLTYADVLENFFAWENQAIIGTEIVDRVSCQILESKPGKGQRLSYASVRSWVDSRRFVPLRIEKYNASGQLARRIDSGRIVTDDSGRHVPTGLTVSDPQKGSVTELDGSKLKHDVSYTDAEFTAEALKQVTTPRSAGE